MLLGILKSYQLVQIELHMMSLLSTWCTLALWVLLTGSAAGWWFSSTRTRQTQEKQWQTCDRKFANGCSVQDKWIPFKNTFKPACNKHDVCYSCAAAYGISRATCDARFLRSMLKICREKWWLPKCRTAASVYHLGVKVRRKASIQ
ncbi:uncharacterized protein LOC124283165 [Haliotis rubra]|uniref:uncharacterized protein LOC124283165 n=1 Tax=Haliotis rubra TaxID=36100 RepID=UPI001EE622FD|nr:uncharacterized protein LOC124283165 [Haliotis rubra]